MKTFIFYTYDGYTESPNGDDSGNLQILEILNYDNMEEAIGEFNSKFKQRLLEAGFENFIVIEAVEDNKKYL